ncbi:MAG: M48 family metallopeptidase [Beijerinckiaceae bacterium]
MAEQEPNAVFLDGETNRRRTVEVRAGVALEIYENGDVLAKWPWESIRRADTADGSLRLRSVDGPELARLDIRDPALAKTVEAYCPNLFGAGVGERTSGARIVAWSLAAAVSLLAVGIYGVPYAADRLAPLLPQSFDNRLGEMVDGQVKALFGKKICAEPAGKQAYAKLIAKLQQAGGLKTPLRAEVLNSTIPNAVALPGGRVYFFKGLLLKSRNVDEVAGVLAHELGHVHHRDSMRKLLQAGGTSFIFGLLFGDVTGAGAVIVATQSLLDKSYTRHAEFEADGFAIETMKALGRSPAPMGELLVRVTGKQGGSKFNILASHPLSEDRLARMKKSMPSSTGEPLLTDAEWKALLNICSVLADGA